MVVMRAVEVGPVPGRREKSREKGSEICLINKKREERWVKEESGS